jgi:hypothetical protein
MAQHAFSVLLVFVPYRFVPLLCAIALCHRFVPWAAPRRASGGDRMILCKDCATTGCTHCDLSRHRWCEGGGEGGGVPSKGAARTGPAPHRAVRCIAQSRPRRPQRPGNPITWMVFPRSCCVERMHVERILPPYTCTMQNTLRDFIELPCAQRAHGRRPFSNNDKGQVVLVWSICFPYTTEYSNACESHHRRH